MKLPDQLIFQFIREPVKRWAWTPPSIPDFAGPADLANLHRSYRARLTEIRVEGGRPVESLGNLSDTALEPLLTMAYQASFLTDEGRPVRACLYAPSHWELTPQATELSPAITEFAHMMARQFREKREAETNVFRLAATLPLIDPRLIARFAPTLAAEDAVLTVKEVDGQVVCEGIVLLDSRDAINRLLSMPRGWRGVGGLFIQILGPGDLRVSEGGLEYTLRANEVRVYRPANQTSHVSEWHKELANGLVATCSQHPDWNTKYIGEPPSEFVRVDLTLLWSRILQEAARMRHGGAFVVVPDVATAPLTLKYPIKPFDLGENCERPGCRSAGSGRFSRAKVTESWSDWKRSGAESTNSIRRRGRSATCPAPMAALSSTENWSCIALEGRSM